MPQFQQTLRTLVAAATLASGAAMAQTGVEITVTNLTRGQSFTPIFAASHTGEVALFRLGEPAIPALAELAEGGSPGPLMDLAAASRAVTDYTASEGLLGPGESITLILNSRPNDRISVAAMLIPTNDTFFAANGVTVPPQGTVTVRAPGYDAGSEPNDELCDNIPGPVCGGEGNSPDAGGEGFVHITAGIQGIGDLEPADYDWRNPVADIVIRALP